jgi:hypothetical protein
MVFDLDTNERNAMLQALADVIDAADPLPGKFRIYSGTKPATPGGAITDQVLLAECACSLPCGTVSGGALTFDTISDEDLAPASGLATWGRLLDGADAWIADFDVGSDGSGAFLELNNTQIYEGGIVRLTAGEITI